MVAFLIEEWALTQNCEISERPSPLPPKNGKKKEREKRRGIEDETETEARGEKPFL